MRGTLPDWLHTVTSLSYASPFNLGNRLMYGPSMDNQPTMFDFGIASLEALSDQAALVPQFSSVDFPLWVCLGTSCITMARFTSFHHRGHYRYLELIDGFHCRRLIRPTSHLPLVSVRPNLSDSRQESLLVMIRRKGTR